MSVTDIKTEGVITESAKETLAAMGKDLELGTVERDLGTVTVEIRALHQQAQKMMLSYAIEIGRRLTEAKALVEHGGWGAYIKDQLGYSQSTANNMMRIYEAYGAEQGSFFGGEAKSQTLGNLTYTQALALLAVPGEEREEFAREHDVEHMSTRELEAAIRERDEAKAALKKAEDDRDLAMKLRNKAWDDRDKELKRAENLEVELRELKAQPIDVPVAQADPEKIKEAVDAAVAAEREKAKGKVDKLSAERDKAKAERDKLEARLKEAEAKAGDATAGANAEVEELRRQLAMADPVTAEFKGLFGQASQLVARLLELVEQAPEDKRDNLRAALRALGEQLGTETGEEPQ